MNNIAPRLKHIYIFIGPPGSGKGSLAHLCEVRLGWIQLSTGNLCRKHITEQTEIGKQIDFAIKSGKLVSDSLITQLVNDWFEKVAFETDAVILDGYPRTVAQAQALHTFIQDRFSTLDIKVVKFEASDEVVMNRLGARSICSNKDCQAVYSLIPRSPLGPKVDNVCDRCGSPLIKRSDDELQSIKERLVIYHKHEQELVRFYESHNYCMVTCEVDRSLDAVFNEFKRIACC